jgi:hypothetical protein
MIPDRFSPVQGKKTDVSDFSENILTDQLEGGERLTCRRGKRFPQARPAKRWCDGFGPSV